MLKEVIESPRGITAVRINNALLIALFILEAKKIDGFGFFFKKTSDDEEIGLFFQVETKSDSKLLELEVMYDSMRDEFAVIANSRREQLFVGERCTPYKITGAGILAWNTVSNMPVYQ